MYKIYWTDSQGLACSQDFEILTDALAHSKHLRDIGRTFVTMVSENPNVVGKPGVDTVIDGKLPNGEAYTWMKRRTQ
jgi:hypothetical protein